MPTTFAILGLASRRACVTVLALALGLAEAGGETPEAERGAYLFAAAGCVACHTDVKNHGPVAAGGRALKTPFGTFYGPNITSDPEDGIGRWSDADFIRALREGVSPDGSHYYPAFPYTSYTRITDADMLAIKAYIFTLPPIRKPDQPHELPLPLRWRLPLAIWKELNFAPGAFTPDPARDANWNRGAYLSEALTHCSECHTPRDWTGGLVESRKYAGTPDGPEGEKTPNITPDVETGIGTWTAGRIARLLETGLLPDGDVVGSLMGEVVEHSTSRLTDEDRDAIAAYLLSLPPIANPEAKATKVGWD